MQPFKIWCETEKEKKAVLRKMEQQGIRWLSGQKPTATNYDAPIGLFVSKDKTLQRSFLQSKAEYNSCKSYQPKSVREFLGEQEKIVIYRDDQKVIALDKCTGEKAEARCNPSDTFDFSIGARIAFDRLIPNYEAAATEPKAFTGEAVFKGTKTFYDTDFTIGRIYSFSDGKVKDDGGDLRPISARERFGTTNELAEYGFLPIVK